MKENNNFSTKHDLKLNASFTEEIWIEVSNKDKNEKNWMVGILCRHPNHQLLEFQSCFEATLEALNEHDTPYLMCDDINIDLLKKDNDPGMLNYVAALSSLGCEPLIYHPTKITNSSSTAIDHFYTNNIPNNKISKILAHDITDHLPVFTLIGDTKLKHARSFHYIQMKHPKFYS